VTATVTRWWWIRHAPVAGRAGRIYGHDDSSADCSDEAAFAALAKRLPAEPIWVTSHLQRTLETSRAIVRAISPGHGIAGARTWIVEPGIAEQHFGEWQGMTWDQLKSERGGQHYAFWLSPATETPPGGESFSQVVQRVRAAVQRLTAFYIGRDIVAIAHGGSIRAALAQALAVDAEHALSFAIDNCSLTRIDHIDDPASTDPRRGRWRVVGVNLPPRP
jgi:broad specificity phosphatase PhoE